ncbi:TD and POZ domain-containing protein 4 [Araneus ventricosus]|uniref:TD and POZ domain-containing protein 4 n=1 Tax=Araneus ventricosus TaxID=182803 RepID=A0A4Y2VW78_ARAVE|nr:TD and POZ domain-containing protein 4 [Araneus ventricosus]
MATEGNEGKYFSIDWKIENLSYFSENIRERIESPHFMVDALNGMTWSLLVYPRGDKCNEDYISAYLFTENVDSPALPTEVKFELALIGKDGSVLESDVCEYNFKETRGYGCHRFATLKDVYDTKRSMFLPQNTLTVRCKIWKKGESMDQDVRYFARTRIGVEKRSFLWNLEEFSTLESENKCTYLIKSPKNDEQIMSVDLFVTAGVNCDEIIRFELFPKDKTIKYSTFRLSLVDASGNKVECNQEELWFDEERECEKFSFFFTRNKLLANKRMFLPNDVLSLQWDWAFSKGIVLEEIEEVQYGCTSSEVKISDAREVNDIEEILSSNPVLDSVKNLYEEKFLCDVHLKTSSGTFPAHKVILSASSSVFKTMFSNDAKENNSEYVDIKELDDDTVKRMLHYIYTSSAEDLTWESATGLYDAANKYGIMSLKNACISYLKENISTSNACEALLLADNQADGDLKAAVLDYIVKHGKEMGNSEWRLLMNSNGKLAAEALYRLFYEN